MNNNAETKTPNARRAKRSPLRFGLISLVMLTTLLALAIEKPVRKYRGIKEIDRLYTKNIGPSEIDWASASENAIAPICWYNEKFFPREIETVRLNWRLPKDFDFDAPREGLRDHTLRSLNQRELLAALIRHPEATENVTTFNCSHPLTPELEQLVASQKRLRVLAVRGKSSAGFVRKLAGLAHLEVLYISAEDFSEKQFVDLAELKWIQWLRLSKCDPEKLVWLREQMPNTYID